MYGKAFLMVLAAGACSHPGPAGAVGVECRSAAKAQQIAGLSGDEACALVRERTEAILAAAGRVDAGLTIELDLSRPGSAIARLRESRAGATRVYPDIAVDVMDRALNRDDLVRLADAIAGALSAGTQPQ
jgi:hypothetical protein